MYFSVENENNHGEANGNVATAQIHRQSDQIDTGVQQQSNNNQTVAEDNNKAGGGSTPQDPNSGNGSEGNDTKP